MKQIIRLTESDLHRLVKESVRRILAETDASAAGGGALGGCNIMNGTSDETGGVAYPFGGGGKKKSVGGNPFNQSPIIRRPSPVGEPTNKKEKGVDMTDALDRKGGKNHSIAMNHVGESVVREAVEESVGNWLKTAALGGMMAFSPMNANAQSQDYQQQGDTISITNKNKGIFTHKHRSPEELMKLYPQVYADRNKTPQEWITNARKGKYDLVSPEGKSLFLVRSAAIKGLNPWDELVNNFSGEDFEINMKDIEPPKMGEFTRSDSIDVLKGNGSPMNNSVNGAIVSFFRNNRNITPKQTRNIRAISTNDLMSNTEKVNLPSDINNYKLVKISGGPFLLMPINYTLQNVQAEMGL
jgi:hypothetical protein